MFGAGCRCVRRRSREVRQRSRISLSGMSGLCHRSGVMPPLDSISMKEPASLIEGEKHGAGVPGSELAARLDALVQDATRSCPQAWSQLYELHYAMVYRRVRLLTGKMSVAEELTQETFVQAMLNISKFRGASKFSTWLFGIAHNLVRHHWRRLKSSSTAHERMKRVEELRPNEGIDTKYFEQERVQAIYTALEELPDTLRVVFVFRYFEGMSSAQVADALNLSVNNVDARASRARRRIKAILSERGWLGNHA